MIESAISETHAKENLLRSHNFRRMGISETHDDASIITRHFSGAYFNYYHRMLG